MSHMMMVPQSGVSSFRLGSGANTDHTICEGSTSLGRKVDGITQLHGGNPRQAVSESFALDRTPGGIRRRPLAKARCRKIHTPRRKERS
jgi:hypothetical protein